MIERSSNIASIVLLCLVTALTAGCGKEAPPPIVAAKGVAVLNGAPLPQAEVRFIPKIGYGAEYIASGVTDADGKFELQCKGQPGACATQNIVVVSEPNIPPQYQGENRQREMAAYLRSLKNRPIPPTYASLVSTPLNITVSEGQPEIQLDLKR